MEDQICLYHSRGPVRIGGSVSRKRRVWLVSRTGGGWGTVWKLIYGSVREAEVWVIMWSCVSTHAVKLKFICLGLVCHPGRAFPLPYLCGKAYGLAGSVQPGPQLSPPSQLSTPESQAEPSGGSLETPERVTVRGRGIHGQEPTYCVLSLAQSITQSVLCTHTHTLTCSSFKLQFTSPVHNTFSASSCCQTPSSPPS